MAGVYLLPDDDSSIIVQPDLTISESHENVAVITEHPVEEGANVADHIRIENRGFTCVLYITRTPIVPNRPVRPNATDKDDPTETRGELQSFEFDVPSYSPPFDATPGAIFRAAEGALSAIGDLLTGGPSKVTLTALGFPEAPFDPVLDFQTYLEDLQNTATTMTVVTTTITYENMLLEKVGLSITEAGGGDFTISFKKLNVVSTNSVTAPKSSIPSGQTSANKGAQATQPTDDSTASLAKKFLNAVGITTPGS